MNKFSSLHKLAQDQILLIQVLLQAVNVDTLTDHDNVLTVDSILNEKGIAHGNKCASEAARHNVHNSCVEDKDRSCVLCQERRQQCLIEEYVPVTCCGLENYTCSVVLLELLMQHPVVFGAVPSIAHVCQVSIR